MAEFYGDPRATMSNGGCYVIRDVWKTRLMHKHRPPAHLRCEYATMVGPNVIWRTCPEGVSFADIWPLCVGGQPDG